MILRIYPYVVCGGAIFTHDTMVTLVTEFTQIIRFTRHAYNSVYLTQFRAVKHSTHVTHTTLFTHVT